MQKSFIDTQRYSLKTLTYSMCLMKILLQLPTVLVKYIGEFLDNYVIEIQPHIYLTRQYLIEIRPEMYFTKMMITTFKYKRLSQYDIDHIIKNFNGKLFKTKTCSSEQEMKTCSSEQEMKTCSSDQEMKTCLSEQEMKTCLSEQETETCLSEQETETCPYEQEMKNLCIIKQEMKNLCFNEQEINKTKMKNLCFIEQEMKNLCFDEQEMKTCFDDNICYNKQIYQCKYPKEQRKRLRKYRKLKNQPFETKLPIQQQKQKQKQKQKQINSKTTRNINYDRFSFTITHNNLFRPASEIELDNLDYYYNQFDYNIDDYDEVYCHYYDSDNENDFYGGFRNY